MSSLLNSLNSICGEYKRVGLGRPLEIHRDFPTDTHIDFPRDSDHRAQREKSRWKLANPVYSNHIGGKISAAPSGSGREKCYSQITPGNAYYHPEWSADVPSLSGRLIASKCIRNAGDHLLSSQLKNDIDTMLLSAGISPCRVSKWVNNQIVLSEPRETNIHSALEFGLVDESKCSAAGTQHIETTDTSASCGLSDSPDNIEFVSIEKKQSTETSESTSTGTPGVEIGSSELDPQSIETRSNEMDAITDPTTSSELSSTGTAVDTAAMEALADRANAIFFQVMEMNLAYEEATAGAKAAKAKSGQVSG